MEQLLGQGDFQKQFEDIMKEMSQEMGGANPLDAAGGPLPEHHHPHEKSGEALPEYHHAKSESKEKEAAPTTQAEKEKAAKAEKSFQDTIKKTMERMQSSSDTATSAAASSSQDDMLAQMLASMESGGFGGEGGDEDFSKILMGMMEQLTNKDILYEPMKELDDKFPKWMENNKDKVDKADLKRYEEQQTLVREIVGRFEKKGYSDSNAQDREYIVERMQKVCIVAAASTMDKHVTNSTIDASRGLSTTRSCRRHECCARSAAGYGPRLSNTIILSAYHNRSALLSGYPICTYSVSAYVCFQVSTREGLLFCV